MKLPCEKPHAKLLSGCEEARRLAEAKVRLLRQVANNAPDWAWAEWVEEQGIGE